MRCRLGGSEADTHGGRGREPGVEPFRGNSNRACLRCCRNVPAEYMMLSVHELSRDVVCTPSASRLIREQKAFSRFLHTRRVSPKFVSCHVHVHAHCVYQPQCPRGMSHCHIIHSCSATATLKREVAVHRAQCTMVKNTVHATRENQPLLVSNEGRNPILKLKVTHFY